MELYYAIVNILDWYTKEDRSKGSDLENIKQHMKVLNTLIALGDLGDHKPSEVADANDCGKCNTWEELITAWRELWKNGERVEIRLRR